MEIKITHEGESADVRVVNPATGETVSAQRLVAGQSITVTATTTHDPADIQVGEPTAPAADGEPPAESGGEGQEEQQPQGEPQPETPAAPPGGQGDAGQPGGAPTQ